MKNRFTKAFTLSELLITIGIVGTVAILTIPNIVKNIYATSYMKKVETAHNTIAKAVEKMKVSERIVDITESTLYRNKKDFFADYLKTSKICGATAGECFATGYGFKNGKVYDVTSLFKATNKYYVVLPNGASVAVLSGGAIPSGQILFMLDGNGNLQPNKFGEDTMLFFVKSNGATGPLLDDFDYDRDEEEEQTPVSPSETNQSCKNNTNYIQVVDAHSPIDCRPSNSSNPDYAKYCDWDGYSPNETDYRVSDYWAAGKKQCDNMGMVMIPASAAIKIVGLYAKNSEGEYDQVFTSTRSSCDLGSSDCSDFERELINNNHGNVVSVKTANQTLQTCPVTDNAECSRMLMSDGSGYLRYQATQTLKSRNYGTVCGCKSKYGG